MLDMKLREDAMRAHTLAVNAGRRPKFGDQMRNLWAGGTNPRRDATFIREVHKAGRTDPGMWYEMTDKKGEVWLSSPTGMIFLELVEVSDSMGGPFAAKPTEEGGAHG